MKFGGESLPPLLSNKKKTNGGVKDSLNTLIWKCKVPLKVRNFLWRMFHNKLQTAVSLKRRGWHGSPLCCVCNKPETVNRIFFECVFALLP
jgi:hypothetical protein